MLTENDNPKGVDFGKPELTRIGKILSIEWLGQTVASLCWICSVFVYGSANGEIYTGDWLQLAAASSWFFANVSTVISIKPSNSEKILAN